MKLFICDIMESDGSYTSLAVGTDKESVESRMWQQFRDNGYTIYSLFVNELTEVDGYEIILKKKGFE